MLEVGCESVIMARIIHVGTDLDAVLADFPTHRERLLTCHQLSPDAMIPVFAEVRD